MQTELFEWDDEKLNAMFGSMEWISKRRGLYLRTRLQSPFRMTFTPRTNRGIILGFSLLARVLLVVHTERKERIRIISARKATPAERFQYESNRQKETQANDDDMRPEYDFSRGLRGVHAYRFSKLSSDEALVLGYWQGKDFELASFAKSEMRDLKTPDFRLSREGVEVALCEVKSFQRDEWLEDQLKHAAPGEFVGGLRPDPVFNRISNAVHTAFKQFESVNPAHRLLNFLFLVNHDTSAKPEDLDRVLTGFEIPCSGVRSTCAQFSEGQIREEKHKSISMCG